MADIESEPYFFDRFVTDEPLSIEGDQDGETWRLERREIGAAHFDGLVCGDLLCGDFCPIDEAGWQGPVDARGFSLAAQLAPDHTRVAALALCKGDPAAPVVSWERTPAGAGVDAGVAGFLSADRLDVVRNDEGLLDELERIDSWDGLVRDLQGASMVLSSSGFGDGFYTLWAGYDADERCTWLALDFDILGRPVFEEAILPLPLARGTHEPLDGVKVRAGWLSRRQPVVSSKLPKGKSVFARVRKGGEVSVPKIKWGALGEGFTLDLREFDSGELLVRRVTHYRSASRLA